MRKYFIPAIVAVFAILTAVFYGMKMYLPEYNFVVLMTGNILMASLAVISFYLVTTQMKRKPDAFVRGVYASSFLKLMVCMMAIMVYVFVNKSGVHKPSLLVLFGIYAIYSITETWMLSRMAKEVN
jgi:hypothetical protein